MKQNWQHIENAYKKDLRKRMAWLRTKYTEVKSGKPKSKMMHEKQLVKMGIRGIYVKM